MQNLIIDNTSLILLLPLWIFLIIMIGRFFAVFVNKFIIYALTVISSLLGALLSLLSLINIKNPVDYVLPFIKINNFVIDFGLRIDKLSLIFALVLFAVSFIVQIFSISYMKKEEKNYRFYALMNLFNFGMAFLLFSPNLFQMYVFWEIVGIVSYLLIGFNYANPIKSDASRKVFIINRIGDTALISAIILTSYFMYNYSGNASFTTLAFEDMNSVSALLSAYASSDLFLIICGLFLLGAFVKSAQFPFHTWLQDAMEAKLPVSALLHSATMVAAGVYLCIRLLPFFTLNPLLIKIILASGIVTAFICSFLAICETQPKKVLAYSTSANFGLMFFAIGLGNVRAAVVFFAAHALIKSALFLTLPQEEKRVPYSMYVLFAAGALSLSGTAFLGCYAKELIYEGTHGILSIIFMGISFLTAFYISRLSVLIFKNNEFSKKTNYAEFFPVLVLTVLTICMYFKLPVITKPYIAAITGFVTGALTYPLTKKFRAFSPIAVFYSKVLPYVYNGVSEFLYTLDKKIFGEYRPLVFGAKLCIKIVNKIETGIFNGCVHITVVCAKRLSGLWMFIQNKNVQTYNAYALVIVTVVVCFIIAGYKILMNIIM